MKIDIKKTAGQLKVWYRISFLFYLLLLVTSLLWSYVPHYIVEIITTSIFIIIVIFTSIKRYNYIFFNIVNNKIILRYYLISLFRVRYNAIEVPISTFERFEINKKIFKLRENIIFFQKIRSGTAKYPSVSISLLSKKQKDNLIQSLIKHVK